MEICKGDISHPTVQIQLVQQQLLFERYRREAFSSRNRKLLADAKNIKALEEYNSALVSLNLVVHNISKYTYELFS